MKKGWQPGQSGLSLMEVVLSLGLFSMFLLAVLNFYIMGVRTYHQGAFQVEAQQNARIAIHSMDRSLRTAESFTIPGGSFGSTIEFYYPGSQRKYTYRVRGGELEYLMGTSVTKVASNITSADFQLSPRGVIRITLRSSVNGREFSLSTAVKPRNIP